MDSVADGWVDAAPGVADFKEDDVTDVSIVPEEIEIFEVPPEDTEELARVDTPASWGVLAEYMEKGYGSSDVALDLQQLLLK